MGKPVSSRFAQMVLKIQDWQILASPNRVYHLHKSVPFTEKRLQKAETGINDSFQKMEHEFTRGSVAEWLERRAGNSEAPSSRPALTACWICPL